MKALVLHHDSNSTLGLLANLLDQRGVQAREHFICAEIGSPVAAGPLPGIDGCDIVVAMGSRWSVYDCDAIGGWIDDEFELLRTAHRSGIPVLGICFGAQVVSAALGGVVSPGPEPNIGWSTIESHVEAIGSGPWFQWHFDVFTVPPGAHQLAVSSTGPEAFRIGRSVGVQFHPELDADLLDLWMADDVQQLVDERIDPDELRAETVVRSRAALPHTSRLLDWFLDEVAGG